MSDTGDTQAQGTGIEEPEAFATLVRHPNLTDEEAGWLVRARDEAVAASARREVVEACCAAVCQYCAGRSDEFQRRPLDKGCGNYYHPSLICNDWMQCIAQRIYHFAAERGWMRAEAAEQGQEGVRDAGTEAD